MKIMYAIVDRWNQNILDQGLKDLKQVKEVLSSYGEHYLKTVVKYDFESGKQLNKYKAETITELTFEKEFC